MAKKKPRPKKQPDLTVADRIEDLVELAGKLNLPDGSFDDELEDACNTDAKLAKESIQESGLFEQLEFLYARGYEVARLEELIREMAAEPREDAP